MASSLSRISKWFFPRYRLVSRMRGHQGAITALSVSPAGVLASGGYDGVRLWQLPSGRRVESPAGGQGLRGPVTSLAWSKVEQSDVLIFGTAGGFICVWRKVKNQDSFTSVSSTQLDNKKEITGIDAVKGPTGTNLVATTTIDGVIKLWVMDLNANMSCTVTVQLNAHLCLRSMRFSSDGTLVRTFSLINGLVSTLSVDNGAIRDIADLDRLVIGSVAFDSDDEYLLIDNVDDGIDVFSFPNPVWLRHIATGPRSIWYGIQVAFGEQSTVVVSGSDAGLVRVFRLTDGQELCSLRHNVRGLVQYVQTHLVETSALIVAGDSNPGVPGTISVWCHRTEPYFIVGVWKSVYQFVSQVSSFGFSLQGIIFLAAFMCVLQNIVLVFYGPIAMQASSRMASVIKSSFARYIVRPILQNLQALVETTDGESALIVESN